MQIEGKKAIVTGAGRGIGRAIALELSRRGSDVAVCDLNPDTAEQVVREVKSSGRRALAIAVDVADSRVVAGAVVGAVVGAGRSPAPARPGAERAATGAGGR